ncbi:MAG: hypothetical protein AB7S26_40080 [Sandaracinaceae bacterium]
MTLEWASAWESVAAPLVAAAGRFVSEHPGAPRSVERGPDGIRALAEAVDRWGEDDGAEVSSSLDEAFVEGAGALFALLLLAHVGRGAHVARGEAHRVHLGDDGFFDPFGAIERALEAEDAWAALALEVRRAEGEARGEVGVGRATRLLRSELARARPELTIARAFGPTVTLSEEIELDLGAMLRATEGEPDEAARRAIEKLVSMLPGGSPSLLTWAEMAEHLVPRLTAPGFASRLAEEAQTELAHRSWLDGAMEIHLVLAYEDRSRFVRAAELARVSVSFGDALAHAVTELARRSSGARFARVDTSAGPIALARTGDGLDAARLLLPTLHDVLSPELGTPLAVAVPHRDALFACAREPELIEAMRARVEGDAARAPHAISDRCFVLDDTGVRASD